MRRIAVVLLAGLLAACGADDEPTIEAPASTVAPSTSAGASGGGGATTATSVAATAGDTALLTAVRVARHDGADRVVFEFRGDGTPGASVRYLEGPVIEDGSGDEVEVGGEATLEVRLEPASGVDLGSDGGPTYTGPDRFRPSGTAGIVELVRTGDFEAVLTWAVGLEARVPFRVTTLSDPPRVVVDLSG